jgi:hypothetical protein
MRAGTTIASIARHHTAVAIQAILVAAIVGTVALAMSAVYKPAGFVAGVDDAAAGGRTSARITVPDGVFGGTTTATANPGGDAWVRIFCYRGGDKVLGAYERVNGDNQATFRLGPTPSWSSGGASCTAEEGSFAKGSRWRTVAETTFEVAP